MEVGEVPAIVVVVDVVDGGAVMVAVAGAGAARGADEYGAVRRLGVE